jgi:hypothetical protein
MSPYALCQPPIEGYIGLGTMGGHAYYVSIAGHTWPDARDNCVAEGGHLVCLGSAEENGFVTTQAGLHATTGVWIGFSDVDVEGSWARVNGEPVGYTNWAPGDPDDNFGLEDVALLNLDQGGQWYDTVPTFNSYQYILELPEIPAPPVPENLVISPAAADMLLNWNPVDVPDVTYRIYGDSVSEGTFQMQIGSTADTMFVDSNSVAQPGAVKFYRVTAVQP